MYVYNAYIIFYTHIWINIYSIYIYIHTLYTWFPFYIYVYLHTSHIFSLMLYHSYRLDGQQKPPRYSSFNAEMLDRPRRGWQATKTKRRVEWRNTLAIYPKMVVNTKGMCFPKMAWTKVQGLRMYHKLAPDTFLWNEQLLLMDGNQKSGKLTRWGWGFVSGLTTIMAGQPAPC